MQPRINTTKFGGITIDKKTYNHDVIIKPDGSIRERNKQLSRKHYGTSHRVSREEARDICTKSADQLIIGTGQYGNLGLTEQAEQFLREHGQKVINQQPTPEAIHHWNEAEGKGEGVYHVTC